MVLCRESQLRGRGLKFRRVQIEPLMDSVHSYAYERPGLALQLNKNRDRAGRIKPIAVRDIVEAALDQAAAHAIGVRRLKGQIVIVEVAGFGKLQCDMVFGQETVVGKTLALVS